MTPWSRSGAGLAVLLAAAVALSACSSSESNSGSAAGSASGSSGVAATTTLNVSVSPGASTSVPVYLGVEKGFFAERGLELNLSVLTNGTVAIPQVISGTNQFSAASFAPVMEAIGKGLPVRVVGVANVIPTNDDTQYQGFIVRDDYTSTTLADAKTIAAQSALLDPVQADYVAKFGGDYTKLQIVQVPLPSIADAVATGSADVGVLQQPFLDQALATLGVKLLSYITPATSLPGTPGAVYIGETKYMKENPAITSAFQAALVESYDFARTHLQEAADFVPKTGLSDKVPTVNALGEYPTGTVPADKFDELLKLYSQYGANPQNLTANDLLYQPAS